MTITLSQALAIVERACVPVTGTEQIPFGEADGRILGSNIVAPVSVPPADNSAVDGYAIRYPQPGAGHDARFALVGVSAAGRPFGRSLEPGEAVRILTGALPPIGADAIAMQEEVGLDGGVVTIADQLPPAANIRRAGEDVQAGETVFTDGSVLGPVQIGMLASLGIEGVTVRRRLRVAIMSAGDELLDAGRAAEPGAIYDANRPTLRALLKRLGMVTTDLGILPDREEAVVAALRSAAVGHDAIVTSAGVSVGDEDHMRAAAARLGALAFSSVAIKPGRPAAFGRIAGVPLFALPGNPAAMLIAFLMIARPGLLRLAGAASASPRRFPVEAGFRLSRKPGRREFLRCALAAGENRPVACRSGRGGAAILSSFAASDGLLELGDAVGDVEPGMVLPFLPFAELGL